MEVKGRLQTEPHYFSRKRVGYPLNSKLLSRIILDVLENTCILYVPSRVTNTHTTLQYNTCGSASLIPSKENRKITFHLPKIDLRFLGRSPVTQGWQ